MIFALRSAGYLVLLIFFWFGVGRALSRWLTSGQATDATRHALHGFAVATLAATISYRWGVPLSWSFRCLAGVSLMGFILQWRQSFNSTSKDGQQHNHLGLMVTGGVLLFIPLAVGGLQFGLIRSNQYDALNYLQSAVVRLSYSHQEIISAGPAEYLQNPLLAIAHWMRNIRPAIVDSYALTDSLAPGNLHLLSPAFLIGILLLAIPLIAELAERLGMSRLQAGLVSLAIIGGFWGQYIVDCDAWSLIGALPLAVSVFSVLETLLDPAALPPPPALSLSVPVVTLLLVYPEQFCFLAPAVGILVLWGLLRNPAAGVRRTLLKAFVWTALLISPCSGELWKFVQGQIHSAVYADHSTLDWAWGVLFGSTARTAPMWSTAWHVLGSLFGVYLPWLDQGGGVGFFLKGALGACIITAAACVTFRASRQPAIKVATSHLVVFAAILLIQTLVIGRLMGLWPAAKALSYIFPWIMLLGFLPLATAAGISWFRWPAKLLLGLQLLLVLCRLFVASDKNGIGYPEPYPGTDPALKKYRHLNVDEAPRLIAASTLVRIDVPDLWLEYYAMICAQAQGRSFVKTTPVREYYDMTPTTFGAQDHTVKTDSLIFSEFDRRAGIFALGFSSGTEVRWSGPRPFTITHISGPVTLESWQGLLSWWGSADLSITANTAGLVNLELLTRLHPTPSDSGRPAVTIDVNGQTTQTLLIRESEPGVLQGIVVPINLKTGDNVVSIRTSTNSSPKVGFSNPHLEWPASTSSSIILD